jgi:predicted DCC family thiol-disulfide oxidoreductase YuxK
MTEMEETMATPLHTPELTLLYDGGCGICAFEIAELSRRDVAGRLALVDTAAEGFDARAWGFDAAALDAEIHGVRADGTVLRGLAALRAAYAAVGTGWMLGPTAWPLLKPLADSGYRVFARHRLGISRVLAPVLDRLALRRARRHAARVAACAAGVCGSRAGVAAERRLP